VEPPRAAHASHVEDHLHISHIIPHIGRPSPPHAPREKPREIYPRTPTPDFSAGFSGAQARVQVATCNPLPEPQHLEGAAAPLSGGEHLPGGRSVGRGSEPLSPLHETQKATRQAEGTETFGQIKVKVKVKRQG